LLFRVGIKEHFDAAHFLRDYPGKCAKLHGHRWVVEVCAKGDTLSELGLLVDFGMLKEKLGAILAELDHSVINEHPFFKAVNPSAENLAKYVFNQFGAIAPGVSLDGVRVFETPDAWADYWED